MSEGSKAVLTTHIYPTADLKISEPCPENSKITTTTFVCY